MSKNKSLEEIKKELDDISSSFCLAKWTQLNLDLSSGQSASCCLVNKGAIALGEGRSPSAILHNTPQKMEERLILLKGERPENCRACWLAEDQGASFSERHYKSSPWWNRGQLEKIKSNPLDNDYVPPYVEVNLGSICQMKCSYCNAEVSSAWEEEVRKYGGELSEKNEKLITEGLKAWTRWLPSHLKQLKVLRLTGGEPILNPLYDECLALIKQGHYPELHLAINTNLCVPDFYWKKYLDDFSAILENNRVKKLQIYTSLEGVGLSAEYMRFGLDFDLWKQRLESLITEMPAIDISITATYNILALEGFLDFLKQVEKWKQMKKISSPKSPQLYLEIATLHHPSFLSVALSDEGLLQCLEEQESWLTTKVSTTDLFEPVELLKLKAVKRQAQLKKYELRAELKGFLEQHDRRRGTSYREVFPKLVRGFEWWDQ